MGLLAPSAPAATLWFSWPTSVPLPTLTGPTCLCTLYIAHYQIYANMKFAGPRLADDKRAGFFLGDGGWAGGASC